MINVSAQEQRSMMKEAIFREYDIRGIAERELSSPVATTRARFVSALEGHQEAEEK